MVAGLFRAIDHEGVVLFQVLFYLILIFAGFQNLVLAGGSGAPLTLNGTMALQGLKAWNWANLLGPLVCLIGKVVEVVDHEDHQTPEVLRETILRPGRWLQLFGDTGIAAALIAYTLATFHKEPVGTPGYGGYLALATGLSTLVLIIRDIRRLLGKPVAL
jgi:hypothetical protein